jgi:lipopolysaccharide export system protein LptA
VKLLWVLLLVAVCLNAEKVEVVADKFFADEKKQISVFSGHVVVTKGSDKLVANKVIIDFDKNRQPLKYTAIGDAKVNMTLNDKKYYGEAETMTYNPIKSQYTLLKKAFLHEMTTDKKVYGDRIWVDQMSGKYEVNSNGNKPVKFIFEVEDKKKKESKK